jgi:hypothetical protein
MKVAPFTTTLGIPGLHNYKNSYIAKSFHEYTLYPTENAPTVLQ